MGNRISVIGGHCVMFPFSLLANSCYKLLENKSLSSNAMLRTAITNLLSTLIQFYKHGIACCLKLAQMLQCFAHTANVLTAVVNTFMTEETMVPFVKELLNVRSALHYSPLLHKASVFPSFILFIGNLQL